MQEMLNVLTKRSFAAGRVRNLIAVLAIALSATLFTSVTAIGVGTVQSMILTMQMQKMSKSDGDFRYMSAQQFEAMRQADFIEKAGLRMPVGFLTNTDVHNIEFDVLDEIQAEMTFCMPAHGNVPQMENEIVASDKALRDLGIEPQVGAEVVIAFIAHGKEYSIPMTVSGWYEATNEQMSVMWAGASFCDENPDIFQYTFREDGEIAGTYWSDIYAVSRIGLQEKMQDLARSLGGNPDDIQAPDYLPAVMNDTTNPTPDAELIVMGAFFVLLFIFCGYLLIYNVFDIAVMQEIRRFGLYRTIGMSRRQVRKLMNRQMLWLSCIGIPCGLVIGFIIGKAALPLIMETFSTEYRNIAADVSPSPIIFLGAAFLTAFTVFISTRKPVRIATDTPPIEAFRYVERAVGRRAVRKSSSLASLSKLAWSNLGRSMRRSVFIVVSLLLCIVLLNCVGTMAESLDIEKQVSYMMRADFAVVNAVSTNVLEGFVHRDEALADETIADICAQPGVKDGAPVYKNTVEDANVTYGFAHTFTDKIYVNDYSGLTFCADEENRYFGLGNDGRPICNVYGMEEVAVARMDLREGICDAHELYEKMANGEGVLVGVEIDRVDMNFNRFFDLVELGEMITVYKNGEPVMELPVLAKAAINGDDMEIGYTCNGTFEIGGDGLFLYLPANVYRELYDEPAVYKYAFDVEEAYQADMTAFLEQYRAQKDSGINFLSTRMARESAMGSRKMIRFVGGLVGLIFGMAGVLNLANMMITSILIRRHEFATMQSVGMTRRQLTKMMVYESGYYAVGASLFGLMLAVVLNLTLVRAFLGSIWMFTFHFTLVPALVVSIVMIVVSGMIPVLALLFFQKESIVEQLRVTE